MKNEHDVFAQLQKQQARQISTPLGNVTMSNTIGANYTNAATVSR